MYEKVDVETDLLFRNEDDDGNIISYEYLCPMCGRVWCESVGD